LIATSPDANEPRGPHEPQGLGRPRPRLVLYAAGSFYYGEDGVHIVRAGEFPRSVGAALLKPQTTPQILRCLTLGRYTATVGGSELRIRGPQPLAGPLPTSIKARRTELVGFLEEWAGGAWPPARGSGLREVQRALGCGLAGALDAVEEALEAA
jgi:hypothetical protein